METSEFSIEEYERFETVDGGDLNWIVPKKLVAFAGPSAKRSQICGYKTHVPEDYVPYFKAKSVSAVVRLNNKVDSRTQHPNKFHKLKDLADMKLIVLSGTSIIS